jgi:hypothetical protein
MPRPTPLRAVLFSFALVACDAGREAAPPPKAEAPTAAKTAGPAAPPAPVDDHAKYRALAPSPLGIQQQVADAGISGTLAKHVPATGFDMAQENADQDAIALRTGVLLAYAILEGPDTPKDAFLGRLRSIRTGMARLTAEEGLLSTIDDFVKNVENDSSSRKDFITELDNIASMMVPENGWGPDDKSGPLLQAGGWLAGTHLVAKAIVEANDPKAANALLHEKEVVAYFLQYVRSEGRDHGPDGIVGAVERTLVELEAIAAKETLTVEDAQQVVKVTDQLFALL